MTSSVVPLKQYTTQSRIYLGVLKQCSLTLAPEMFITKVTKRHPLCGCHDNSYIVLIKTRINLKGRVKIIWVPVEALEFFFRAKIGNCLNFKYHWDDHISISSAFPQFKSTSYHVSFLLRVKMNSINWSAPNI